MTGTMIELNVKSRESDHDARDIRAEGSIPAVFYGKKTPSTSIIISEIEFMKVWKKAGESTVVTLKHAGGDVDALIHDVDIDPVTGVPRHADFYVFDKSVKIEVAVPLEFIGVSAGVKDFGGSLVKVLHEIKIEALPSNLPSHIEVDISSMAEIGSQITAAELKLPAGVSLLEGGEEEVVALVAAPKSEEEEESVPIDLSAIEVAAKGKEKTGEGESEEVAS